jgi:hypothetical protein
MPPRFAYWTILIDQKPTAFRAREADELMPTLHQLKRKNADVVMKWFARGKLWDSQAAEREAFRTRTDRPPSERRNQDWRPGGEHKDPRARFDKEKRRRDKREQRAQRNEADAARVFRPPQPPGDRPWSNRPPKSGDRRPPAGDRKPWSNRPPTGAPRGDRPWIGKPKGNSPGPERPPASDPTTRKPKPPG